jgi:hypothetical protein
MERYAASSVKQQIDRILWEVWDPGPPNKECPMKTQQAPSRVYEALARKDRTSTL